MAESLPLTIPEYTALGLIAVDEKMVRRLTRDEVGGDVPEAEINRIAHDTQMALAVALRGRSGSYRLVGESIADVDALIIHRALTELEKETKEKDGLRVDFLKLHGKLAEVIEEELTPCLTCGEPLPDGVDCPDCMSSQKEDP